MIAAGRVALLRGLFGVKVKQDLNRALEALGHGFDVAFQSSSEEIRALLLQFAREELEHQPLNFCLAQGWDEVVRLNLETASLHRTIPLLVIGSGDLPLGSGFVMMPLPSIEDLLPSIPKAIVSILEHFGLECFVDVFEGRHLQALKSLLKSHGLGSFIDAVVQVAYLAGFLGQEQRADSYLVQLSEKPLQIGQQQVAEDFSALAAAFFSALIALPVEPHPFLKAALTSYVVHAKARSYSDASRILQISRTTLTEHLKLADELKISSRVALIPLNPPPRASNSVLNQRPHEMNLSISSWERPRSLV